MHEETKRVVVLTKGIGKRDRETSQTMLMLERLSLPREAGAKHDRRIKRARPIEQIEWAVRLSLLMFNPRD